MTKPFGIRKLCWASDIHLEFCDEATKRTLAKSLREAGDAVLLTGDISIAPDLVHDLSGLAEVIGERPIFVLGGNHDRYHGTFKSVEEAFSTVTETFTHVRRLTGKEVIPLSEKSCLVGVDGWADGRAGLGNRTKAEINDDVCILDLKIVESKRDRFKLMSEWSREYTETLRPTLISAFSVYEQVVLATHVPPFANACRYQGRPSDPEYLPYFCNVTLGEMILEVAVGFRGRLIRVLCGHTHEQFTCNIEDVACYVGGAQYGSPRHQGIVEVE